jgi:hypothetical protein
MTIELSFLMFTEQDDIVPQSGQSEPISNTYIANTLAGNDRITGTLVDDFPYYDPNNYSGFINVGELNTDDGNDIITGELVYSIRHSPRPSGYNIINFGLLNTGEGNDRIDGSYRNFYGYFRAYGGIYNSGTLNAGEGDDTISGLGIGLDGFVNNGTLNTEDGNDIITAFSVFHFNSTYPGTGFLNNEGSTLNTGEGNDTIIGRSESSPFGILNESGSTINTGNGEDSINSVLGTFSNAGYVFLGQGNDSITATYPDRTLENFNAIETGDGDDIITITGVLYNEGVINTGNGDDSIIVYENFYDIFTNYYSIYNNGGSIDTGDGNDSIITNANFRSGENNSGAWFLGEGEDYIKGFGNGDFYGGNGNDTLELISGTYTVGIWGEGGESPIFTKGNQLMITSEFETLIAGGITYNFASLTAGQIITVPEV